MTVYAASPIKRRRATKAEMDERAAFLIDYANQHGPVTSRGLYYQAEVAGIPGIDKTERGYSKVQRQVLQLRRAGKLGYDKVADATRYMRKPTTFDGWENALQETARLYRKNLWSDSGEEVEIWIEKSALAGVIFPVTAEYDVPLMPSGGFTSETFAHEAVARLAGTGRKLIVYSLYDFDRSGSDATRSLQEKVERFGADYGVPVSFNALGLTYEQVLDLGLPTRAPKRGTMADKRWPYDCAAELDAIPPDTLRAMVRGAIERHLPAGELAYLKEIENAERATLLDFIGRAA
ncbi:hypothetical protein [uncultured Roseovarius sp.]|uniref:hypothetical protein n=1 Tax=uncultured Roseovarius sp. TaxID=293344 RepID=UPI0026032052|nr:hypothetical protein [uncultured Roseovarius sp.]